ncbi:MAG: IS5 family transposase [Bdellovibrionales bacterium]|nr:IS5 family transposase [Bdellovibrionales bacterium]
MRNWRAYNAALVEHGSLGTWCGFDDTRTDTVTYETVGRLVGVEPPPLPRCVAVQCGLVMREVFHLPLRALEGFMQSVITLLGVDLAIPDYSTFSRRAAALTVQIGRRTSESPRHIVIDSTGLKVYGAGEWHRRQHRVQRRRTWRKLHLAVDTRTHEVIAAELTAATVQDAEVFPALLEQIPADEPIASIAADGAYDTRVCHQKLLDRPAEALIPPPCQCGGVALIGQRTASSSHGYSRIPSATRGQSLEKSQWLSPSQSGRNRDVSSPKHALVNVSAIAASRPKPPRRMHVWPP